MHKTLYVLRAIALRTLALVAFIVAFAWLLYWVHRLIN